MVNARSITSDLGGTWHGRYGTAPCPICQAERRPSQNALTVTDGDRGLLLHCKKAGCDYRDLLAAIGITSGSYRLPDPAVSAAIERESRIKEDKRSRQAAELWRASQPIHGTLAEQYLRARGINCAMPPSLRFHPNAWHPSRQRLPCMVAKLDGTDRFAVHRTYLRADGCRKADVNPSKAMLGATAGGAVRLSSNSFGPLVVAEGIETALSLACGLLKSPGPIWAALSTSGMRALRLPRQPSSLVVAMDGDDAGTKAGFDLADRAEEAGWAVSVLVAPDGRDWNDELLLSGVSA